MHIYYVLGRPRGSVGALRAQLRDAAPAAETYNMQHTHNVNNDYLYSYITLIICLLLASYLFYLSLGFLIRLTD